MTQPNRGDELFTGLRVASPPNKRDAVLSAALDAFAENVVGDVADRSEAPGVIDRNRLLI